MFFNKPFTVIVYNPEEGGIIGDYKTFVMPLFGDNFGEGQIYKNSPNYIIHKRVLLTDDFNKRKVIVFVSRVDKLVSSKKLDALMPHA